MKVSGLAAAGMGLMGTACANQKDSAYQVKGKLSPKAKARKIIFIMTDTQRYDMLGCVNKNMKTHGWINWLAKGCGSIKHTPVRLFVARLVQQFLPEHIRTPMVFGEITWGWQIM